jgi:dethiobiotin synthetase
MNTRTHNTTGKVYMITGIDTDCGKTMATGLIAKTMISRGGRVITQKLVQTGCTGMAADIAEHRRIMGVVPGEDDLRMTTCPQVFSFPASPHLAAELDGTVVDIAAIDRSTAYLRETYDTVLLEGAGGLHVPLTRAYSTIDFIAERGYPLILVSGARLGSINHTLMSIELCTYRGIELKGVVYNLHPVNQRIIADDSRIMISTFLQTYYPSAFMVDIPVMHEHDTRLIDNLPDL